MARLRCMHDLYTQIELDRCALSSEMHLSNDFGQKMVCATFSSTFNPSLTLIQNSNVPLCTTQEVLPPLTFSRRRSVRASTVSLGTSDFIIPGLRA
jgi:hypothetical protein